MRISDRRGVTRLVLWECDAREETREEKEKRRERSKRGGGERRQGMTEVRASETAHVRGGCWGASAKAATCDPRGSVSLCLARSVSLSLPNARARERPYPGADGGCGRRGREWEGGSGRELEGAAVDESGDEKTILSPHLCGDQKTRERKKWRVTQTEKIWLASKRPARFRSHIRGAGRPGRGRGPLLAVQCVSGQGEKAGLPSAAVLSPCSPCAEHSPPCSPPCAV